MSCCVCFGLGGDGGGVRACARACVIQGILAW